MGGAGAGGGGRRREEVGRGRGPHVLRLPQDVPGLVGQEHGHLVVHVVVLLHHAGALATATVHIHLGWRRGGEGVSWQHAIVLFQLAEAKVLLSFMINEVSVWVLTVPVWQWQEIPIKFTMANICTP